MTILIPAVTAAYITPRPATINGQVKISLAVIEREIILEPDFFFAGEIQAGEDDI